MASIESLIAQIEDAALREKLGREVAELKKRFDWGLVFERHLPESVRALSAPIRTGSVVWERRTAAPRRMRVRAIEGQELLVVAEPEKTTAPVDAPIERIARGDILIEQDFAESAFPVPTPIGAIRNGPADKPYHAVIEGENYHVLESLLATYPRQVDVIYLDPPYNTGDGDWAYNNDYVDPNDTWRPSKWLAFMERRLRLGRRLLKSDGVMVVTIDENEVHHLGMLLDQMFPDALIQMVTICMNPTGTSGGGFSRVDEYAYFLFFGRTAPYPLPDNLLTDEKARKEVGGVRWEWLMRGGNWYRVQRPALCYPVVLDPDTNAILGTGAPFLGDDEEARSTHLDDKPLAWPVRSDGRLGIWRVSRDKLMSLVSRHFAYVSMHNPARGTWTLRYLMEGTVAAINNGEIQIVGEGPYGEALFDTGGLRGTTAKTMWFRPRHIAGGVGGTQLVSAMVGNRSAFTFPKSVYAVRDTLDILTHHQPNALVVDFFAGSGTTLHATLLLNLQDGGRRRCVLVTNNEVKAETAAALNRSGYFRGDPEFEAAGVFEVATRPRVTAAITGVRPDGQPVKGTYLDGREYAEGFEENVEFFRLDYLDPAEVEFGLRFAELHPLLWLRAGGLGERTNLDSSRPLGLPANSPYAVLFDPSGMIELLAALPRRKDIRIVFIVADSAEAFAHLSSDLPRDIDKVRLYRDYLEILRTAAS